MSVRTRHLLILGLACFAFFMFGNGLMSLTGPDEVFYTQTAKEMAARGEWLTPYLFDHPQFEKPILLYWLLRIAGILFGFGSFSMRLFPALFAGAGVGAVYLLGLRGFGSERKAFLAGLILASSLLYVGLARTVFTDMLFSVLILLGLLAFYWGWANRERASACTVLFFVFSGLAVLAKGPLGFLIPAGIVCVFMAVRREFAVLPWRACLLGTAIFLLIAGPWYAYMIAAHGRDFLHEFFVNDHWRRVIEAEHRSNDTWYFYPASIVGGMFPWSMFAIAGLIHAFRMVRRNGSPIHVFLGLYVMIILLAFQAAHSKLASYVFPVFPALALMSGDYLVDSCAAGTSGKRRRGLLIAGAATSLLLLALVPCLLVTGRKAYGVWPACGPIERVLLLFAFLGLAFTGAAHLYLVSRGKAVKAGYALTFTIPVILLILGVLSSRIEPYVSAERICERFSELNTEHGTVLCSKSLVRSVRYYTGRNVAAVAIGGRDFFSPHPIALITRSDEARSFLGGQGVTYCIVKNQDAASLESAAGADFRCASLRTVGDARIMRIEASRSDGVSYPLPLTEEYP